MNENDFLQWLREKGCEAYRQSVEAGRGTKDEQSAMITETGKENGGRRDEL
jgi:hypothetical protein